MAGHNAVTKSGRTAKTLAKQRILDWTWHTMTWPNLLHDGQNGAHGSAIKSCLNRRDLSCHIAAARMQRQPSGCWKSMKSRSEVGVKVEIMAVARI